MERRNEKLIAGFAAALKERRKAVGLSQEELAFRADLSMSYISLLETRRRQPTLSAMAAICKPLGVSIADMMADVEGRRLNIRY